VPHVLGEHREKVPLVNDQEAVQALATDGTDPPLSERIRSGRPWRGSEDADPGTGEHIIEGPRELCVPVTDQEFHLASGIVEFNHQIPRLLGHPIAGRMRGDAQDMDSAGPTSIAKNT
jgi:hypothetical protein